MPATPIKYTPGSKPEWWFEGIRNDQAEILAEEARQSELGTFRTALLGEDVLDIPEPDWLLENFIVEGGLTLIYGAPSTGKSFIAIDWANTLASPNLERWIDFKKATPYLRPYYLMQEGQGGISGRVQAWNAHQQRIQWAKVAWQMRMPVKMNYDDQKGFDAAQEALFYDFMTLDCDILFIDTLSQTFRGNENQQDASQAWVEGINRFRNEGKAVVVVHHTPKDGKSIRGSNVVEAASDIAVKMEGGGSTQTSKFIHARAKDVPPVPSFTLKHKSYQVGTKVGNSIVLVADGAGRGVLTSKQQPIFDYLLENPNSTSKEIADKFSVTTQNVTSHLKKMVDYEQIRVVEQAGGYTYSVIEPEVI